MYARFNISLSVYSVIFSNFKQFSHYCPCPTITDIVYTDELEPSCGLKQSDLKLLFGIYH